MFCLFPLFVFFRLLSVFFFPFVSGGWGEGDLGDAPTIAAQAGSGVGYGYTGGKAKSCPLFAVPCLRGMAAKGSGDAAAIALRAACSGLEVTESKPNQTSNVAIINDHSDQPE